MATLERRNILDWLFTWSREGTMDLAPRLIRRGSSIWVACLEVPSPKGGWPHPQPADTCVRLDIAALARR